jgi:hypothetical protein
VPSVGLAGERSGAAAPRLQEFRHFLLLRLHRDCQRREVLTARLHRGVHRPGFIAILKQMAPYEGALLDTLYADTEIEGTAENEFRRYGIDLGMLSEDVKQLPTLDAKASALAELHLSLDGLMAQQLIAKTFGGMTEAYSPRSRFLQPISRTSRLR